MNDGERLSIVVLWCLKVSLSVYELQSPELTKLWYIQHASCFEFNSLSIAFQPDLTAHPEELHCGSLWPDSHPVYAPWQLVHIAPVYPVRAVYPVLHVTSDGVAFRVRSGEVE